MYRVDPHDYRIFYISGPMEGYKDDNKESFDKVEKVIKDAGQKAINPYYYPVDIDYMITKEPTRQDYYRKDIRILTRCTDIIMLRGWNVSHGAQFERYVALELGIKIHYEEEIENGELKER